MRELNMHEIDLVSGGGDDQESSSIWARLEELGDIVANAIDVNNDGDVFDEVALGAVFAAGAAAYLGAAPAALTFTVIAGWVLLISTKVLDSLTIAPRLRVAGAS